MAVPVTLTVPGCFPGRSDPVRIHRKRVRTERGKSPQVKGQGPNQMQSQKEQKYFMKNWGKTKGKRLYQETVLTEGKI